MTIVSTGNQALADVEYSLNDSGLGEVILRNVYFPIAGEDKTIPISNPYIETQLEPNGNYRYKVMQGDRRAQIRRGSADWKWDEVTFVSNKDDVYVDIAIDF